MLLAQLERARDLIARRTAVADDLKLLVFSAAGFDRSLAAIARRREDVELVDLERLYSGG